MGVKLFHHDKPLSGLEISTTGIKVMSVNPKTLEVLAYGSIDIDPAKVQESLNGDPTYLGESLKQLLADRLTGHLPSNQIAISVPTSRTYSRTMTIPADTDDVYEAVSLEVEQYVPIPVNELYLDFQVVAENSKERTVLVSAVPKKIVDVLVAACEMAGLQVIIAEPGINATARLIKATEEGHLPSVIVDIGAATSDIGLLEDSTVRLTGSVAIGGHTFTYQIAKGLNVSLEEAHQLKVHSGLASSPDQKKLISTLEPMVEQIVSEIRKILRYYKERVGVKTKIEQIIIAGGGSNVPGLGEVFTDAMKMPARVANPWQAFNFGRLQPPGKHFKSRYTTAAGLSLIVPGKAA